MLSHNYSVDLKRLAYKLYTRIDTITIQPNQAFNDLSILTEADPFSPSKTPLMDHRPTKGCPLLRHEHQKPNQAFNGSSVLAETGPFSPSRTPLMDNGPTTSCPASTTKIDTNTKQANQAFNDSSALAETDPFSLSKTPIMDNPPRIIGFCFRREKLHRCL